MTTRTHTEEGPVNTILTPHPHSATGLVCWQALGELTRQLQDLCLDAVSGPGSHAALRISNCDFSHVLALRIYGWCLAFSSYSWVGLREELASFMHQGQILVFGLASQRHLGMLPESLWEMIFLWIWKVYFFSFILSAWIVSKVLPPSLYVAGECRVVACMLR